MSLSLILLSPLPRLILLSSSSLSLSLIRSPLLSTPLTSQSRLIEGSHLLRSLDINPYANTDTFHHPLLLLLAAEWITDNSWIGNVIACAVDLVMALMVERIASRRGVKTLGPVCVTLYHPYAILTTAARSTQPYSQLALLASIDSAMSGNTILTAVTASFAVHLNPYALLVLPPLVLLLLQQQQHQPHTSNPGRRVATFLLTLITHHVVLHVVLSLLLPSPSPSLLAAPKTFLTPLLLPLLPPNPSLSWYFFIELFDHFRPFFLSVFPLFTLSFVPALSIKFKFDPLLALTLVHGVGVTLRSYGELGEVAGFHTLLALSPHLIPYLRHPLPTSLLYIYATLLLPTFYHLWTHAGTGNANFYYAATLVLALANAACVVDAAWAGLRGEFERSRKGKGEGEVVVQR